MIMTLIQGIFTKVYGKLSQTKVPTDILQFTRHTTCCLFSHSYPTPVPLDVILECDGRADPDVRFHVIFVQQVEQQERVILVSLYSLQKFLRWTMKASYSVLYQFSKGMNLANKC